MERGVGTLFPTFHGTLFSNRSVKEQLKKESDLSPALRSALEVLLLLVSLLLNRVTLSNKNDYVTVKCGILKKSTFSIA